MKLANFFASAQFAGAFEMLGADRIDRKSRAALADHHFAEFGVLLECVERDDLGETVDEFKIDKPPARIFARGF